MKKTPEKVDRYQKKLKGNRAEVVPLRRSGQGLGCRSVRAAYQKLDERPEEKGKTKKKKAHLKRGFALEGKWEMRISEKTPGQNTPGRIRVKIGV